jgi:hypothetical protein
VEALYEPRWRAYKVFGSLSSFRTTWEVATQILQQRSASAGEPSGLD